MKIKIESFTNPITEDVLNKKDFAFPSGSGGGGGGGGNTYNFNAGVSNIQVFGDGTPQDIVLPSQYNFSYIAEPTKKGMIAISTPRYLTFLLNGDIVPFEIFNAHRTLHIDLNFNGNFLGRIDDYPFFFTAGFPLQQSNTITLSFYFTGKTGEVSLINFGFVMYIMSV